MDSDDFISSSFGGGGGIENASLKRIFGFLDTESLHEMKRPSKRFKECVESVLDERLPNVNYDNKIYLQLITSSNNNNTNNYIKNINNNDDDSFHWLTGGLYAGNITVQVTNPTKIEDKQPEEKDHLKHYYAWRIQKCIDNTSSSDADADADADADDALDPMQEELEGEGETMEGKQHNIKYGDIIYLQKVNINEYSENKWLKGGEGYNQESVNTLDLLETTNNNSDGCSCDADSYQWKIRSCTPLLTQQSSSFNNDNMDIDPKHGRTVKYNDPICLQMINNHQNRWLCGNSISGCVNSIPFDGQQQQQQQYYPDNNNTNNPFDDDVSPMLSFRFRIRKEFVL